MGVYIRLQRFLSQCGAASRRNSEQLILEGRVAVNGKAVTRLGTKVNPFKDIVTLDGAKVAPQKRGVLLFNKPAGVVSTLKDPQGRPCLGQFIPPACKGYFPVGRLDYESSGLMVLTNDGLLAQFLLHPRYRAERTYIVKLQGVFSGGLADRVKEGIELSDGFVRADVAILKATRRISYLKITITVGKNRVIRRMMEKLGFKVLRLERVSHGPFFLKDLAPGEVKRVPKGVYLRIREELLRS